MQRRKKVNQITIQQLLESCGMGFDHIVIIDKDSGESPIYYKWRIDVIFDYGKWEIDSWEIGFDVIENKPFACLLITV